MTPPAFDRAAAEYDATRGFPPGIADQVAAAVADILQPGACVLEIGIGTGRIARPLLTGGLRLIGIDLSRQMMQRLLETLPPDVSPPALIEADAERLPLASGAFDAVVAVHVLHLILDWRAALVEARRSLKPDGALLIGYDWRPPDSPGARILKQWQAIIRARLPPAPDPVGRGPRAAGGGLPGGDPPGARDFAEVTAALLDMGARLDERTAGEWTTTRTLARHLESIEHRTWTAGRAVPADFFPTCLAELRAWATREYGPPERQFTVPHKFVWQKFSWR
jgi:SAM-dependent methyltransferase